jgi:hypothetical protein
MAWCNASVYKRYNEFVVFISKYLGRCLIPILDLYLIKEYPVLLSSEAFSRKCEAKMLLLNVVTCFWLTYTKARIYISHWCNVWEGVPTRKSASLSNSRLLHFVWHAHLWISPVAHLKNNYVYHRPNSVEFPLD